MSKQAYHSDGGGGFSASWLLTHVVCPIDKREWLIDQSHCI